MANGCSERLENSDAFAALKVSRCAVRMNYMIISYP
jgi:hypothetical protein